MKYSLILFDADDTLLDFRGAERVALRETLARHNLAPFETFYSAYREVSGVLWKKLEKGEIDQNHLKIARFQETFSRLGLEHDANQLNRDYMNALCEVDLLIDGALELCRWLGDKVEIGIATNGLMEVQARRIAISRLRPYIGFVAISEACGFAKPDRRFFEYAASLARPFNRKEALMVGDREADVRGAKNYGIDACYFNPLMRHLPGDLRPKFEIRSLSDLRALL